MATPWGNIEKKTHLFVTHFLKLNLILNFNFNFNFNPTP